MSKKIEGAKLAGTVAAPRVEGVRVLTKAQIQIVGRQGAERSELLASQHNERAIMENRHRAELEAAGLPITVANNAAAEKPPAR